jgi:hypothetical protein
LEPKGISFNDNVDTKNWGEKRKNNRICEAGTNSKKCINLIAKMLIKKILLNRKI